MDGNSQDKYQKLYEEERFTELLDFLKADLVNNPDDPNLLYNAGLTAYLAELYSEALQYWMKLKNIIPDDVQLCGKLIQTYEALGKKEERDKIRDEIYNLIDEYEDPLTAPTQYCRDQFGSGSLQIRVFENFKLLGELATRYTFYVFRKGEEKPVSTIVLGSFEEINQYMRERGELKKRERAFHLDEYFPDNSQKNWGFFVNEPSYDEIKDEVRKILAETDY